MARLAGVQHWFSRWGLCVPQSYWAWFIPDIEDHLLITVFWQLAYFGHFVSAACTLWATSDLGLRVWQCHPSLTQLALYSRHATRGAADSCLAPLVWLPSGLVCTWGSLGSPISLVHVHLMYVREQNDNLVTIFKEAICSRYIGGEALPVSKFANVRVISSM